MPAKNSVKTYVENAYYHIYNRGVEGRDIFKEAEDYKVFLSLVKRYLATSAPNEVRPRWKQDLADKIQLTCYSLMPNHVHLLVKQFAKDGVTSFMRSLMDSYVRFFNQKYARIGGLFQGKFKAVQVENEAYLLHLTRYIHLNPLNIEGITLRDLEDYYCSYGEYIGKRNTTWIKHKEILANFGSKLANIGQFAYYRDFVEKYKGDSSATLEGLILE